jgi:plastocyanin
MLLPAAFRATAAIGLVVVQQQNRAFSVASLHIVAGAIVRFTNADEFGHQIFVSTPEFSYESDESYPGENVDVRFTTAGTFDVRCHIHPKMHLAVQVD